MPEQESQSQKHYFRLFTCRLKDPLRMEENEIITQFIENPEDEYSLQMISTLFKSQNLDYLTY